MHSPGSFPRLVGDVGGTNARLALIEAPGAAPVGLAAFRCAEHASLQDVLHRYLDAAAAPWPRWCAIGIANPIVGDQVQMTNHSWSFSIEGVRREFGFERLLVINDFTALALSLPALRASDLKQVGGGAPVDGAPVGLVGPGTGLGVSGLVRMSARGQVIPINGEGGHMTLAPMDDEEGLVIAALRRRFGHVSAERAVSGPGLRNLYEAVCEVRGVAVQAFDPPAISAQAMAAGDAQCTAALTLFCSFLGNVAGNVALLLGARAGLYIGGGIVPRLSDWFDRSPFRVQFEAKGRFAGYLQQIPTYVVQAAMPPALTGAARALDEMP
jgi:glucokinase